MGVGSMGVPPSETAAASPLPMDPSSWASGALLRRAGQLGGGMCCQVLIPASRAWLPQEHQNTLEALRDR